MDQITVNTIDAKEQLTDLINQVAHHKKRIIVTRRGKEIAALISIDDFKLLMSNQDKRDLREATEALKEAREGSISLEKLIEEIGS